MFPFKQLFQSEYVEEQERLYKVNQMSSELHIADVALNGAIAFAQANAKIRGGVFDRVIEKVLLCRQDRINRPPDFEKSLSK